jgi:hypothetical protein
LYFAWFSAEGVLHEEEDETGGGKTILGGFILGSRLVLMMMMMMMMMMCVCFVFSSCSTLKESRDAAGEALEYQVHTSAEGDDERLKCIEGLSVECVFSLLLLLCSVKLCMI